MLKDYRHLIKVNSKIKKVLRKDRIVPALRIGGKYYVSFEINYAYPCSLSEIVQEFEQADMKIKVQLKDILAYFSRAAKIG